MGANMLLSSDDLGFMIEGVFSFNLGGHTLWITTSHICLLIVFLTLIVFSFFAKGAMLKAAEVPQGFQNVLELIVEFLDGIVDSTMGKHAKNFRNYIGTRAVFPQK